VPDAVDAAVLAQEASAEQPLSDLAARQPGVEQLLARDDAVLRAGDRRDLPFSRPALGSHHDP
jgi:hypothetical protein